MAKDKKNDDKDFLSFIQESGLIWGPSPEIYGGLAGFYTYGPLGKLLKNKVENSVRKVFNQHGLREIEGPTVVPDIVWKASGHLDTFKDRLVRCSKCNAVFRADKLIEESHDVSADAFSNEQIMSFIREHNLSCPTCKGRFIEKIETQSLMMKTVVAGQECSLRPETATVTYLPYPNFYNYFRRKIPFGVFQIGKAYRNEISPRQHVIRGREFTQAEGQIFVDPKEKNEWTHYEKIADSEIPLWDASAQKAGKGMSIIKVSTAVKQKILGSQAYAWCLWLAYQQFVSFGIPIERIRLRQHQDDEKAFYAQDAWDIEVKLNHYGWTELCGVHDRGDYDLTQHAKFSKVTLDAMRENGERFVPHVLEIAFGTDRPTYALIDLFYEKKGIEEGKTRFAVPYKMAPIEVSIFPLMKKPELVALSERIKAMLESEFVVEHDVSGSIGRRYLRSASAGTPFALTIDYDSLEMKDVTIRDRDSEKQIRVPVEKVVETLRLLFAGNLAFKDAGKAVGKETK